MIESDLEPWGAALRHRWFSMLSGCFISLLNFLRFEKLLLTIESDLGRGCDIMPHCIYMAAEHCYFNYKRNVCFLSIRGGGEITPVMNWAAGRL